MNGSPSLVPPPTIAFFGKSILRRVPFVIFEFAGTLNSITSASVPVMYLTWVTLGFVVCLKILLAADIFLFIMVSIPVFSARFINSMFSTSAIVFFTPSLFARRHERIFVSEFPVTDRNASIFVMPSCSSRSTFLPSPLIISVLSRISARSSHFSILESISLTSHVF